MTLLVVVAAVVLMVTTMAMLRCMGDAAALGRRDAPLPLTTSNRLPQRLPMKTVSFTRMR